MCTRVCVCPRASLCVCKEDKGVHLPPGRCERTGRVPSVGGDDWVPETWKMNWRNGEERPQLALSLSLQTVLSFLFFFLFFFFLGLVAHAMSRCRFCTGMLCGPECPVPWLPKPGQAREPWRPRAWESGPTSFMLMNAHWGRIYREGAGVG